MTTAQKLVVSVMVLAAIAGGVFMLLRNNGSQTDGDTVAGAISGVNHYENGVWWFGNGFFAGLTQGFQVNSAGTLIRNGLNQRVTQVSCNGNSLATSTTFAYANPFSATSTATFVGLSGTGQATTSTLLVGTSTASTGRTAANVSPSFINVSIATNTPFYTAPGIVVGPGTGYNSPGAGTFRTIVVAPGEFVVGTATSAPPAAGYIAGLGSCSGSIIWDKF